MEIAGDRSEDERENEKIESVQRPAEERGDDGIALVATLGGRRIHRSFSNLTTRANWTPRPH